ncbi:hypothetical protein OC845_005939 [Tilletia horrida]|nr:hypothetical protein OC845_005939 [Tilletia horrida]
MVGSTSLARRQLSPYGPTSGGTPNTTKLPTGTCTSKIPCAEAACCNGAFCGFGPEYCGTNCTSKCDSKAECGPYANAGNTTCPLGVCCSRYGFCGTTDEFCGFGCQNGCGEPAPAPLCEPSAQSATQRRIGYYAGWATDPTARPFNQFPPSMINANALTHINYAFALIGSDFRLQAMSANDPTQWSQVIALKSVNPSLKVFLSVGGWSFNDPPTSHIFSNLVGSAANTNTFINSALSVMQTYGFDGIDIDWEYPGADDRGGVPADRANYVKFMTSLNNAFKSGGRSYGLTWTAPSSYWYLQHFDLQGLTAVTDWINLMTYDLHGVWDGVDPYIGPYLLAHTNLSEIMQSVDLFARNRIPMSKITLGMGFYGRSFTMADPSCSDPGCPFSGAGRPLGSSVEGGTESYADILTFIADGGVSVFDEQAAVKYLTYGGDQWVSYDDADTFLLKMNYANSICIGGTMIWSVDQDTPQGDALAALYPDILGIAGQKDTGADSCQVTLCGESCPAGFTSVSKVSINPALYNAPCDIKKKPASLCCPTGAAPTQCHWNRGPSQGPCAANACAIGEVALFSDPVGDGSQPACTSGNQILCCKPFQPQPEQCVWGSCENPVGGSFGSSCPSNFPHVQTSGVQGDPGSQACWSTTSLEGDVKPLCCSNTLSYTNCAWHGTFGFCYDNQCPVGQVAIATDVAGDGYPGTTLPNRCTGTLGGVTLLRSYCCDPPPDSEAGIPGDWLFPNAVGAISETLQIDPDTTGPAASAVEALHYNGANDPEHNEFGEVFISSPNAAAVSRMDARSDWVITGCHPSSEEPQQVLAYCQKGMNDTDSGCSHVMTGGTKHTIIRLPKGCARGNWARVDLLEAHPDQNILPNSHSKRLPPGEKVYRLHFDYNFAVIPEDNGPVYMRVDASNIIGYWDEVVDASVSKRHVARSQPSNCTTDEQKRSLHDSALCGRSHERRWWGAFKDWISRVTNSIGSVAITNSKHYSFSQVFTIFHQEESCTINDVQVGSSLDISATLNANADLQYGLYIQATVVPPAIQSAYVDFNIAASGAATLTVTAEAAAHYSTGSLELIRVPFPGLSYPGLVTVGPSIAVYGELDGDISMQGTFSVTQGVEFPASRLKYGWSGVTDDSSGVVGTVTPHSDGPSITGLVTRGNIAFSGTLTAHVKPSVELGIRVLGGSIMDAHIYGRVDLATQAALSITPSQMCVTPNFNAGLSLGYSGSVLVWDSGPVTYPVGSYSIPFNPVCSGPTSKRDLEDGKETLHYLYASAKDQGVLFANDSTTPLPVSKKRTLPSDFGRRASEHGAVQADILRDSNGTTKYVGNLRYPMVEPGADVGTSAISSASHIRSLPLGKRAGVPYLPGNLFCPASGDTSGPCAPIDIDPYITDPDRFDLRRRSMINYTLPSLERSEHSEESSTEPDGSAFRSAEETSLSIYEEVESGLRPFEKRVVIANCHVLRAATYDTATDLGWWDFARTTATTLNPTVARNLPPLLTALSIPNTVIFYALEHVYEMNLLTRFIDEQIKGFMKALWQVNGANTNFCDDFVRPYLVRPFGSRSQAMVDTLRYCQPRNGGRGMPRLQQQINKAKSNYLNGQNACTVNRFNTSCAERKLLVLRQVAGALSYMNDGVTRSEFLAVHQCVSQAWDSWHADYVRQPGVPSSASSVAISEQLAEWTATVLTTFNSKIRSNVQDLINSWSNTFGDTPQTVRVSYGAFFDNRASRLTPPGQSIPFATLKVTTSDLQNNIGSLMDTGITWINQL